MSTLMQPQITTITRQTLRQAAEVLGRAFADEPVSAVIYHAFTPQRRIRSLTVDFCAELQVCLRKGYPLQICQGNQLLAAALIYPPGAYPLPLFDQWMPLIKSVLGNGLYDVASWMKWLDEADKIHPTEAHYYLEIIGVDPLFQGQGFGTRILEHLVARADLEGVGCYLETASPHNLPLYQRYGFKIMCEKEVIGLPAWFMWREPRSPK